MVYHSQKISVRDWVKVRSNLTETSSFLTWKASIYSWIPGETKKLLLVMLGMNVSRCIPAQDDVWQFMSRELCYYLKPETGEILHQWENPWTGEIVPVVHVANDPVQGTFKGEFPAEVGEDTTTFIFDLFPTYPNPLAGEKFKEYSPDPIYQSVELFKITAPTKDLLNPELKSVKNVQLGWQRIGSWLPWMKMGDRPGFLIYSGIGSKVENFAELPELLQTEINQRMGLYKEAPNAYLDVKDMTSWRYFDQHFDAYLAGEEFPISQM